ncbi:LysR family transcriptional regulator [Bordetella genomosp. 8]|uniref:LysR family transcriptional regulator n=1 Tax=Bordetella genomosp. 8 TaxID=1416806 RepID=A0A1W6YM50_9BORD|nr:LysR family transcriptional regulator [Bordetella genomosp. 8]ARP82142.1 LysR family transcriptional regulator [Bordetella genomosp. 8]
MEFRQIQYFVCLYEEGSVTRAARRLNIVQPALSMQIAKLEQETGRQLFVRSSSGMQPTPEARQMYRIFMPVLADFARAREQVMQTDAELSGQVRVGMIATIAQGVMVDALMAFTQMHPKVALALVDGYSGGLIDAVAGGQLDAAVINKPRRPLALATEPITEENLVLVTGSHHPGLPAEIPLRRLAGLKLVLPTRQHGLRGIIESFAQAEDVDLAPTVEIDSISAILKLVHGSDFASVLPQIAVTSEIALGRVRTHAIVRPRLTRQVVCVTHPRRTPGAAATAFLRVLLAHVHDMATASA